MSCFVKILFLMQIFTDPRKYGGKGHIEGLLRALSIVRKCQRTFDWLADFVRWSHVHTRILSRFSLVEKPTRKYWKNCEGFARVVLSFYWLKIQREDFEKMRWLCEFRLPSHWLKIPRANFAK